MIKGLTASLNIELSPIVCNLQHSPHFKRILCTSDIIIKFLVMYHKPRKEPQGYIDPTAFKKNKLPIHPRRITFL